VRVSDYIKLDSGAEGYVLGIGRRSTRIRLLANNAIVPNRILARAIITNYDLPESRMARLLPLGVSYDADHDRVEAVACEEVLKVAGGQPASLRSLRPSPGSSRASAITRSTSRSPVRWRRWSISTGSRTSFASGS
jgi:small-conductance mechanosensitive channel